MFCLDLLSQIEHPQKYSNEELGAKEHNLRKRKSPRASDDACDPKVAAKKKARKKAKKKKDLRRRSQREDTVPEVSEAALSLQRVTSVHY